MPGPIGHLLPEEREPLKTACFPKQMRHKNDRAVLTRLPHPVRHNRSACFITKIFELELPKSENTYRAESTLVISHVCVCVLAFLCMCVCVCVRSRTCLACTARRASMWSRAAQHECRRSGRLVGAYMFCLWWQASRCWMQAVCNGDARSPNSSSLAARFGMEECEGTQTCLCAECSYYAHETHINCKTS